MLRYDFCGLFCVALVYFFLGYADYVVIFWMIMPTLQSGIWGPLHILGFNVVVFLTACSHLRTMLSDPGIVPICREYRPAKSQAITIDEEEDDGQGSESDDELYGERRRHVGIDWTICTRCETYRPPRAHHCRICKRCVRRMDHHCPWVNNCVGEGNQKYFLQFVGYVAILAVYAVGVIVLSWMYHDEDSVSAFSGLYREEARHYKVVHTVCLSIESSLFGLFVVAISCDQMQAIFNEETLIEAIQRRTMNRRRRLRRGKCMALRDVCGPSHWTLWGLPCISLPSRRELIRFAQNLKDSRM